LLCRRERLGRQNRFRPRTKSFSAGQNRGTGGQNRVRRYGPGRRRDNNHEGANDIVPERRTRTDHVKPGRGPGTDHSVAQRGARSDDIVPHDR
jgi:hypothetical protein